MAETGGTPDRGLVLEAGALVLLTLGSLVSWVGWAGGVLLLWTSDRWSRRDKLLGTLVLPGGLIPALLFARGPATTTCTGITVGGTTGGLDVSTLSCGPQAVPGILLLLLLVLALLVLVLVPLSVTGWLGWRARRRPAGG